MLRDSKSLETSCYILGAGAFGVFIRWMQYMIAYDDEGLVDPSFWTYALIAIVIAQGIVFYRFSDKRRKAHLFLPNDFCAALKNEGMLYQIIRIAIGAIIVIGSLLLIMQTEASKNAVFYRVTAVLGIATGVSFPFLMAAANRPAVLSRSLVSFLATIPVLLYAAWLLTCYRVNSINPVYWDYTLKIFTLIISMAAVFRTAGFAFGQPNEYKSMTLCMWGAALSVMNLADLEYISEGIMFIGVALMLIYYNWIMIANLRQGRVEKIEYPDDGFERL